MKLFDSLRKFGFSLLIVALSGILSFAQTSKGTIAGVITDSSGAVVSGATITARDKLAGQSRETTTGGNGQFRLEAVNPSTYEISVSATGFAPTKLENVDVRASVITSANATLKVGGASETVSVESSALAIETDSAELSKTISEKEITELPVNSLNPLELVLTEPGAVNVSARDNFTQGVSYAVDGLRPRGNGFLIDGFDNNDAGIHGQAIQPQNLEAIQEVAVQTNSYAAEFGGGGASLANVIYKSGSNTWHGALWELYSGTGFNAITAEQHQNGVTVVPRQVRNTFGYSVGGPVIKNKLFVFGTTQWDRLFGAETGSTITIPTAAGVATLKSLGSSQNANILLTSLGGLTAPAGSSSLNSINIGNRPGCNVNPCAVQVATFQRQATQQAPSYEYDIRTDFTPTEKDTFTVRFLDSHSSLTPDLFANTNALPGVDSQQGGPSRNLGAYWTHVFSNRAINEIRFTSQNYDIEFAPTSATAASQFATLPDFRVSGLTGVDFGGLFNGLPQFRKHQVFQYQDAVSIAAGNHSLKMGVDLVHFGINDSIPFNSRGLVSFTGGGSCAGVGLTTCTGLANYLDNVSGQGGSASINFGSPQVSYPQTTQAYYVQDSWKLRSNLTVNYGLRYEYSGTPFNSLPFPAVNEKTALTDPITKPVQEQPYRTAFGPRFGIAYTPHFWTGLFGEDKTVFRAGFGTFYDSIFANITDNTAGSTPNVTGGTFIDATPKGAAGRGTANPAGQLAGLTPTLRPTDAVSTSLSNLMNPKTYQWNANIERELPGGFLATVAYVGTRGEHLFLNEELNPGVNDVRLNPNRGPILARSNHGDSIYHGLQLDVNRRFRHGLLIRGAYTFSKSIDDGSEVFVTTGGSTRVQQAFNFRGDRGPSAFDRRQRAVFTWVYDFPYPHGDAGAMKVLSYATRGWQISGTAAFETGAPDTLVFLGADQNGDLSAANDRPSLGNPAVPINYTNCFAASATCNSGVGFSTDGVHFTDFNSSFDPNFEGKSTDFRYLFIQGKNGNIGRNTFYNPGRQDWTLSLQREINVYERHTLQLRLEAFNPFNHANFGGGTGLDGTTVFPISTNLLDPNFLNAAPSREGGRSLRAWVKYSF